MTFKENMTADLSVFFNTDMFADSVFHNGSSVAIPAVFDFDTAVPGAPAEVAIVYIKKSDIAEPKYRDAIVRKGETWHIHRDQDGGRVAVDMDDVWQIKVTANERFGGWGK